MPDKTIWDINRGRIFSSRGGWFAGKGAFCLGYNINQELVGKISYLQLVILNATGRLPEKRFSEWLGAVFMGLSWPDSRIWCNQIGAYAGTMRASIVAATAAGMMAGDSKLYAQKTLLQGVNFIQEALGICKSEHCSANEIVDNESKRQGGKPQIVGYARPIANGDERISPLEEYSKSLGYSVGEHLKLAYDIERVLQEKHGETMNVNGYISAFLADQGYSAEESYRIGILAVNSGVTACYLNSFERPANTFLPLRCEDIDYQGPPPRPVPSKR